MTHIKVKVRNDLKGAEHQRVALQEPPWARRQRAAADGAGPNHVVVLRKRSVAPAPDVAQDGGLKFRHDVQGDDLPARREGPAHRLGAAEKLQESRHLKSKITATATMKTRTFIGPDFFPTDKKRSRTSQ